MSVDPIPCATLAVLPVVDYEPPARAVAHRRPPVSGGSGRKQVSLPRPGRPARVVLSPAVQSAAAFAETALRRVLEVVDQRRSATHLHPLLAAGLIDSVLAGRPAAPGREAATLQRVRLQVVGAGSSPTAVEVFGNYRRGRQIHAVAGRIESVRTPTGPGWQLVALHIG